MLRRNKNRSAHRGRTGVRAGQATAVVSSRPNRVEQPAVVASANHPMVDGSDNGHLYQYEQAVKKPFDSIVPVLRKVSALQHEEDFVGQAQAVAQQQLGFQLPEEILQDAWVDQLDMRSLFAWSVFKTYQRFCDEFFEKAPLSNTSSDEFQNFLQGCGFHTLDVSPCADGRLAHAIR